MFGRLDHGLADLRTDRGASLRERHDGYASLPVAGAKRAAHLEEQAIWCLVRKKVHTTKGVSTLSGAPGRGRTTRRLRGAFATSALSSKPRTRPKGVSASRLLGSRARAARTPLARGAVTERTCEVGVKPQPRMREAGPSARRARRLGRLGREPVRDQGQPWQSGFAMSYFDGFVLAVPTANRKACRKMAEDAASMFKEHGALAVMEAWGEDVPRAR